MRLFRQIYRKFAFLVSADVFRRNLFSLSELFKINHHLLDFIQGRRMKLVVCSVFPTLVVMRFLMNTRIDSCFHAEFGTAYGVGHRPTARCYYISVSILFQESDIFRITNLIKVHSIFFKDVVSNCFDFRLSAVAHCLTIFNINPLAFCFLDCPMRIGIILGKGIGFISPYLFKDSHIII